MPEGKMASSTLLRATPLLALALRAAADGTTARVTVDTAVAYNSSDWSSSWVELESVRNILGTMNGPREVYAFDDEHGAYDTAQYAASFDELAPYAVRFNDMNYLNGGYNSTSITQIFRAWPLTDAALSALTASEIAALASDDGNYVWEGVDYNVGGACAAGSVELMDFRVGDTYQVTNALNKGEAVPMGGGNATTFPASWMFPTDVLTENGIALWAAVATRLATRVREKLCASQPKVVFDILTEIYIDSEDEAHFWPHNASVYARLYAAAAASIKAAVGDDGGVSLAGPNVLLSNSKNEDFFTTFIEACHAMGYAACPLDVATFHYFSPDSTKPTSMATWMQSAVWHEFHDDDGFDTPRLAITAFGLHGSGEYDYYGNVTGAALVTEHIVTLQGTPVDFCIFYKFDGGNCGDEEAPCLVQAESGELKPNAEPFALHSRLLAAGGARLAAELDACGSGGVALAAYSGGDDPSLAIMLGGTGSQAPQNLVVLNAPCGSAGGVALTTASVVVDDDGVGAISETTVAGSFSEGYFYEAGESDAYELPIEVDANNGYFSALLTLSCVTRALPARAADIYS